MSRTRRKKDPGQQIVAPPVAAGSVMGWPVGMPDRRVVVASVILRNAVAVVGVLFLGWSGPEIVVLYFLDTLAAVWGIFTGVMYELGVGARQSLFDRAYWWGTALALSLLVTAFLALPLGMPVGFVAAASGWQPLDSLATEGFRMALVAVVVAGLVGALFRTFQASAGEAGMRTLKWEFSLVFGRWFVFVAIIYTVGMLFFRYSAVVMVIVYAAISVVTELYPQRFVRWIDSGTKR